MRKQWIALAVTLTLSVSAISAHAATIIYSDTQGSWAQTEINTLVDMKVMSGFNDGLFHPDAWVTRAEFTNMAAKTLGLPPSKADQIPSLKNVARNNWRFNEVDNQSWISSYPTGVYRPGNPLRRVEALAGLAGTLNKPLVSSEEADQILSQYSDASQIPTGVRRDVATAIKYNLFAIEPTTGAGMIAPLRPATRAEVAALLNDLYENRDIAIVQNGQIIAAADSGPGTTTRTTTTTTTTTTGVPSQSQYTTVTAGPVTGMVPQGEASISYSPYYNKKQNWWTGTAPFRNSADTVPITRSINQTTTPNNLDATATNNLPTNVTFTATVAKALYSEFNRPGDPVVLILDHALMDATEKVAVPAGSQILGYVSSIVSRNTTGDNAQIGITLTEFVTPTGQRIPINATIANPDGILKAGDMQGVVFQPDHSLAALKREIHTAEGGMYGTKIGKAAVLDQPFATQVSDKPLDPMDKRSTDIVVGVGDRVQVKLGSPSSTQ